MSNGAAKKMSATAEYPYDDVDKEVRRVEVSTHDGVPKKQGKKHKNPPTDVIRRCATVVVRKETHEDGIDDHVVFCKF